MMLTLLDQVAEQNVLSDQIKIEPKNQADKTIKGLFNQNWNMDNFGPLKIPEGKCFVIGDNRHNSEDSRYIGLINESDIVGTVIKNKVLQQRAIINCFLLNEKITNKNKP